MSSPFILRRPWAASLTGLVLLAALAGAGCERTVEGPAGRPQKLALSPQQELALGRQAYQEVLQHPDKYGYPLSRDTPEVERTLGVASRLIRAASNQWLLNGLKLHEEGYTFEWQVNVLKNSQVNAFCLPAGKIAVFTGILPVARDDAQLATVLGHEISHALAHHSSERLAREQKYQYLFSIVGGLTGGMDPRERRALMGVLGVGAGLTGKSYDRQQESEADHIGLYLMTFAGYDPHEAVAFWQRMEQMSKGGSVPTILSDHPSHGQRMQDLERWIPDVLNAKRMYEQRQGGTSS